MARKSKYSTDFCIKYASKKNGKFLSPSFQGYGKKHRWKCKNKDHPPFESLFSNMIRREQWCPHCAGNVKLDFGWFTAYAKSKGGKCLSKSIEYKNNNTRLTFECKKHGLFKLVAANARAGKWCKTCGFESSALKQKDSSGLLRAIKYAKRLKGKCLSTTYTNFHSKLVFKCEKETHPTFKCSLAHLSQGRWCPLCGIEKRSLSLKKELTYYKRIAAQKGYKILTDPSAHKNAFTKLQMKCKAAEHPPFMMTANDLQQDKGCPNCSVFRIEKVLRYFFEFYFETSFLKIRPSWLEVSKNSRLELDFYSEPLQLAFEHQGRQHYEIDGYYNKTKIDLLNRKKFDLAKKQACRKRGVLLIEIPEIGYYMEFDELKSFLIGKLKHNKRASDIFNKNRHKPFSPPPLGSSDYYLRLKKIVGAKGGKILSPHYFGPHNELKFQCNRGHSWHAPPARIVGHKNRKGSWCPKCNPHKNQFSNR